MQKKFLLLFTSTIILFQIASSQVSVNDNLIFDSLPARWDEAIPLGNGMLGALIWQKNDKLRFSLDRADLWDERPAIDLSKLNFKWVQQQVAKNQYDVFAQGLQEMLLQSYSGIIEILPAIQASWKDISFNNLRAEGAFLISAIKTNGTIDEVTVKAEQGGTLHLKLPFKKFYLSDAAKKYVVKAGVIVIEMSKGEKIEIKNGFE